MSQGCPVINTNLQTAVPYVSLNNYTGKTIIPNDHQSLANAINKFPNRNSKEWSYYSKTPLIDLISCFHMKHLISSLMKQ